MVQVNQHPLAKYSLRAKYIPLSSSLKSLRRASQPSALHVGAPLHPPGSRSLPSHLIRLISHHFLQTLYYLLTDITE